MILRNIAPEAIKLHIRNIKNGPERCFLTFENMLDMSASQLNDEVYMMSFRYFRWDKDIIVRKLLYLGECVTVISPDIIKDDIIKALKNAINIYIK